MQIALTHKGQAALWVTNGCTSMSNPITTWSTPMGVDNKIPQEQIVTYDPRFLAITDILVTWFSFTRAFTTFEEDFGTRAQTSIEDQISSHFQVSCLI